MEEDKAWSSAEMDSYSDKNPILLSVRQILQNISYSLNHGSLLDFDFSLLNSSTFGHEVTFDIKNSSIVTMVSYFKFEGYEIFLALSFLYFQYILTFTLFLIIGWIVNRQTLKSEIITHIFETVISLIIFAPALPPMFVFFFGVLFVRLMVSLYLTVFYPDGKITLLNPVDGFWAYEEFASSSTNVGLYIIEGKCDLQKIRERMKTTIESDLVGGKMSRKILNCFGFFCWETIPKGEMDITNYVKVIGEGYDKIMGEQDLFKVMRKVQDQPIQGQAPWSVIVIPHFSYDNQEPSDKYYAVIYWIHHAIMDGISTGNILHSVMADKPFTFSLDPTEPLGLKEPKTWETALVYLLGLISMPRVGIRNLCSMDNHQYKSYKPGQQLTGPKTFTWTKPIKMDALKQIKNLTKTSVYSVLLSSLGGALRQYSLKHGDEDLSENFHVMSPIALLPYPDRKPRNRFTGVIVPTNVEDLSCLERLHKNFKTVKQLGSSSATFLAIGSWYYPVVLGCMPTWMHKSLSTFMHLRTTLSNVPGPREDVWIYDGGKIVDTGIWVPIKYSIGLGMGLFSYKDRVRATLVGDEAYYSESDVHFIISSFESQLARLGKSVGLPEIFIK